MASIYILIAFLGGVSVVASRILNSKLSQHIGIFSGSFYNFLGGLIFTILLFIVLIIFNQSPLENIAFVGFPLIYYFGGLLGLAITALSNYYVPKISAFYFTLFMFTGQLFSSMIFDYILFQDFSIGKLLGAILVIIGLAMNLQVDKEDAEKAKN